MVRRIGDSATETPQELVECFTDSLLPDSVYNFQCDKNSVCCTTGRKKALRDSSVHKSFLLASPDSEEDASSPGCADSIIRGLYGASGDGMLIASTLATSLTIIKDNLAPVARQPENWDKAPALSGATPNADALAATEVSSALHKLKKFIKNITAVNGNSVQTDLTKLTTAQLAMSGQGNDNNFLAEYFDNVDISKYDSMLAAAPEDIWLEVIDDLKNLKLHVTAAGQAWIDFCDDLPGLFNVEPECWNQWYSIANVGGYKFGSRGTDLTVFESALNKIDDAIKDVSLASLDTEEGGRHKFDAKCEWAQLKSGRWGVKVSCPGALDPDLTMKEVRVPAAGGLRTNAQTSVGGNLIDASNGACSAEQKEDAESGCKILMELCRSKWEVGDGNSRNVGICKATREEGGLPPWKCDVRVKNFLDAKLGSADDTTIIEKEARNIIDPELLASCQAGNASDADLETLLRASQAWTLKERTITTKLAEPGSHICPPDRVPIRGQELCQLAATMKPGTSYMSNQAGSGGDSDQLPFCFAKDGGGTFVYNANEIAAGKFDTKSKINTTQQMVCASCPSEKEMDGPTALPPSERWWADGECSPAWKNAQFAEREQQKEQERIDAENLTTTMDTMIRGCAGSRADEIRQGVSIGTKRGGLIGGEAAFDIKPDAGWSSWNDLEKEESNKKQISKCMQKCDEHGSCKRWEANIQDDGTVNCRLQGQLTAAERETSGADPEATEVNSSRMWSGPVMAPSSTCISDSEPEYYQPTLKQMREQTGFLSRLAFY